MILRRWLDSYQSDFKDYSERAQRTLVERLSKLDPNDPDFRKKAQEVYVQVCWYATEKAATMAALLYDGIRAEQIGETFGAVAVGMPDEKDLAIAASATMAEHGGLDEAAMRELCGRMDVECKRTQYACMEANGAVDPRKPRFARVPGYSRTYGDGCPFCKMQASRGFEFHSRESAGEYDHWHADCACKIIPSWEESPTAEGYDPDAIYEDWMEERRAKAAERAERNGTDFDTEFAKIKQRENEAAKRSRERNRDKQNRYAREIYALKRKGTY